MRRVIFHIDNVEYMRGVVIDCGFTERDAERLVPDENRFRATFGMVGDGEIPLACELVDQYGNPIPRSAINSYQRIVILNDCFAYFAGRKMTFGGHRPEGVVLIEEDEV